MTTSVDVAKLAADAGPKVVLAGPQDVLSAGTSTVYTGFSSLSSVYVEAQVQLQRAVNGAAGLTVLIEHSTDGNSWSTAETFTFGADGTQGATLSSPNSYIRASWSVANRSEWYLRTVFVAVASAGGGGGGGGTGTVTSVTAGDGSITAGGTATDPTIAVHPDGSTLEVGGSALRVKDAGVTEAKLSTSDVTTLNASTSKHGFLPKIPAVAEQYVDGLTGAWTDLPVKLTNTATLTNKRITRRTGTTASSATPTINTDNVDFYSITALAAAITSFTSNLSGTPTNAQTLWISITDDGSPRAITWGASFESSGNVTLPSTTVTSTRLDVGFVWNTATSKWRCVAVS